ncbi:alpha/beta hydrolase [Sphingomonas sp. 3-13AW]|uniref:alpha/beta hydrolase n=1 Tax=Sphingomonas sp. 3-13AW TaxID=3050450 RepID=UPI003BB56E3D
MRLLLAPIFAFALIGTTTPETRFSVTLARDDTGHAGGRLLLFAEAATAENATFDAVDIRGPGDRIAVAARDITDFGPDRRVTIDTEESAFSTGFTTLPAGPYRVQVVLDRNRDYAYGGRGPGDLVSKVVTVRFPLTSVPSIALEDAVSPAAAQFDTAGLPPRAAEQITASRAHLHEEQITSNALTRFRGTEQKIRAWILTPPGYDSKARVTYPTVYTAGGFGTTHKLDGQQLSRIWHLMEAGAIPPMIWVAVDYATATGTTEFADSVNNGPWGLALVTEVIPTLEARYRMDAKPSGRFLTGHSSGGWFALWTMVRYPAFFGGSWATSPDPVDFHDFLGVDLYAPDANMYRDSRGAPRPLERDHGKILATIEQAAKLEAILGRDGGQFRSFDCAFSPRGADGSAAFLFDRQSGAIEPTVAAYWRENYDISRRIETNWGQLKPYLEGKVHVTTGAADSFYLERSVRRLEGTFRKVGARAEFTYVPNASHGVSEVYARGEDRSALWKEIASAMYAVARPGRAAAKDSQPRGHNNRNQLEDRRITPARTRVT